MKVLNGYKNKILIMIEYNFRAVFYILSKSYNLVKMVFLPLIFDRCSGNLHVYIINLLAFNVL